MFNYDKLNNLIKVSGKTKTFLCRQIGKPPYYLRDVIRQRTSIPMEYQRILARELNTTVEYMNDEEEKEKPATEVTGDDALVKDIMSLIGGLDEESRRKAKDYIQYLKNTQK